MNQRFCLFAIAALAPLCLTARVQAEPVPQPDSKGDFYRNEAPVKGSAPAPLMAGSLWRVVSPSVNCRRQPGVEMPVLRQLKQGAILQAEVYRGGADEVLLNIKDTRGKPWMAVRGEAGATTCYVRANRRYIQPVVP